MFSELLDKFSDTFNSLKETATGVINKITGNTEDDTSSSDSSDDSQSWLDKLKQAWDDWKNDQSDDDEDDQDSDSQDSGDKEESFWDKITKACCGKSNDDQQENEDEEEEEKKKGGSCGGGSNKGDQAAEYPGGTNPDTDLGEVGMDDVDDSTNDMCKKVYTIHRAIPKDYSCPVPQRDNVADQFTPQDDLLTMEKTCRDFMNLEGKVYDPESTNPRFFAPEGWVQHFEKDKNTVLALQDQYKANILRMEHLYTVADNNSYTKLLSIPNQDCKASFQTNIMWTARALKDYANNWFIKKTPAGSSYPGVSTPLFEKDYWLPGLTGQMVQWMKLGSYCEFNMRPIAIETMIKKVESLEGIIDRLMNKTEVAKTIEKFMNVKEVVEQDSDQTKEKIFTSKIIDSQMGKKLGVTDTGTENHKTEGTVFKAPKEDSVESYTLKNKLSPVKAMFKQLREKGLDAMKESRCVSQCGAGNYPEIWCNIDTLFTPVERDLNILNELIEDDYDDYETPGKHCSVTHCKLCPQELKKRVTSFKCIIQDGVIDVMVNQAMLPKKGLNILDSMFNQLWEYGEKGPTIVLPNWCQMAIDSINRFEASMLDAWDEVFDCWEREFTTRLWDIEVDHHTANFEITQTRYAKAVHNHQHPFVPLTMMTLASIGGDSKFSFVTPVKAVKTCPGHLEKLMRPVCIQYRVFNIAHLARHYRTDIKSLCQWMCAAIEAIGIKLSAISAVMSDPTLNGDCGNEPILQEINDLREKNDKLLNKVEDAYGIYSDVDNMKNKKEYDEEIALHELQPNQYSNEDQLNMTSSVQPEADEKGLDAELCEGGIDIPQLKPWNHLEPSENKVDPKPIPCKCACNKFDKLIRSAANFEKMMNLEDPNFEEDEDEEEDEENQDNQNENQEEEEKSSWQKFLDEWKKKYEEAQAQQEEEDSKSWFDRIKEKLMGKS